MQTMRRAGAAEFDVCTHYMLGDVCALTAALFSALHQSSAAIAWAACGVLYKLAMAAPDAALRRMIEDGAHSILCEGLRVHTWTERVV